MKDLIGICLFFIGIIALLLFFAPGCEAPHQSEIQNSEHNSAETSHCSVVGTMVLETRDFVDEVHSNGRLRAIQRSRLPLRMGGELKRVNVINGQAVMAGEVLGELCSEELQRQVERAGLQYTRTRLDLQDILLGQGYHLKDSASIPEITWQMAGLRSGYFEARNELRNLENDLLKTHIVAPYNGVVADLDLEVHEQYHAGEPFCTLIDDTDFLVDFYLMEKELDVVNQGASVIVFPVSHPEEKIRGHIYSVNPLVGKHGQVKAVAKIPGEENLLDGMHAKIVIQRNIPGQLVVPKSAVIYREDEEVLFKVSQGRAEWTYVTILNQNGNGYSVISNPERRSRLEPGDTIIVSNNIHLAHGSPVTPQ
jgi:membrane fusion protein, multidrug efflux system